MALRLEKIRQAASRRLSGAHDVGSLADALSDEERDLRQTLLRLVASEASGDLSQADETLREALERYPDRTAFRIAEAYLSQRNVPDHPPGS